MILESPWPSPVPSLYNAINCKTSTYTSRSWDWSCWSPRPWLARHCDDRLQPSANCCWWNCVMWSVDSDKQSFILPQFLWSDNVSLQIMHWAYLWSLIICFYHYRSCSVTWSCILFQTQYYCAFTQLQVSFLQWQLADGWCTSYQSKKHNTLVTLLVVFC